MQLNILANRKCVPTKKLASSLLYRYICHKQKADAIFGYIQRIPQIIIMSKEQKSLKLDFNNRHLKSENEKNAYYALHSLKVITTNQSWHLRIGKKIN